MITTDRINQAILALATADIGTWEWAGKDHNPKVIKYYADAGHPEIGEDEVPWCAAFVGAILARAGVLGTGSLLARSYEQWGEPVDHSDAMAGDIIVFKRGNSSWQGHVAIFVRFTRHGAEVIGGNQGNRVTQKVHKAEVLAIRRAPVPRDHVGKSKALGVSGAGVVATVTAGAGAIAGLEGTVQIVAVVFLGIMAMAFMYLARDRVKKWAAGVR